MCSNHNSVTTFGFTRTDYLSITRKRATAANFRFLVFYIRSKKETTYKYYCTQILKAFLN